MNAQKLSFKCRADLTANKMAQKLFHLMDEKKTNLAVNADVTSKDQLLHFADLLGPEICVFKTHIDILEDFDQNFVNELKKLANKHRFFIFEDRKFTDIGAISKLQYQKGIYKISEWADIINAMTLPGPGIIQGLGEAGIPLNRGLLLVAELSSSGSLATGTYTEESVKMAIQNRDFVMGFISQRKLVDDPGFIHFTPGVQFFEGGDGLGQQYNTPKKAIQERGSDVIIVGRGIIKASDPKLEAARYREAAWVAAHE